MIQDFIKELKNNKVTAANLVLLLTLFATQVRWQTTVDSSVDSLREKTVKLEQQTSYEVRSDQFVPRKEAEAHWESIEKTLDRIEKKLDK